MFSHSAKLTTSRLSQISKHIQQSTQTMTSFTNFKLNTEAYIPALGFGTWRDASSQEEAVTEALNVGYRHIDTARMYPQITNPPPSFQQC
jgi:hypothetical protein